MIIIPSTIKLSDIEDLLNQVLMTKSFLRAIPDLYQSLRPAKSLLLTKIREHCQPEVSHAILAKINEVIETDAAFMKTPLDMRNQRTFAVRSEVSALLDVARQTYKELTEDVHAHVAQLNGECYPVTTQISRSL